MIINGWLSWAERDPGPPEKVYSQANACRGLIPHSQEGTQEGSRARMFCMDMYLEEERGQWRFTDYAAVSWTASILRDGTCIEHYPLTASCWTTGSRYPNTHFPSLEFEGFQHEALTEPQEDTFVRVICETSSEYGWKPKRPVNPSDVSASLYEHRECVRWGSKPTACPSDRINWTTVLRKVKEVSEKDKLIKALCEDGRRMDQILRAFLRRDYRRLEALARSAQRK